MKKKITLILYILFIGGSIAALFLVLQKSEPSKGPYEQVTGRIKELNVNLELTQLKISQEEGILRSPIPNNQVKYYEVGIFTTGEYKDYKQIIEIITDPQADGYTINYYATNDYKTYIATKNNEVHTTYAHYSDIYIASSKVTQQVNALPNNFPKTIELSSSCSLKQVGLVVKAKQETGGRSKVAINTDLNTYRQLKSNTSLRFYIKKIAHAQKLEDICEESTFTIIVVDQTEMPYLYKVDNK